MARGEPIININTEEGLLSSFRYKKYKGRTPRTRWCRHEVSVYSWGDDGGAVVFHERDGGMFPVGIYGLLSGVRRPNTRRERIYNRTRLLSDNQNKYA